MALERALGSFPLNTSTGNQPESLSWESGSTGITPKVVIFWGSRIVADGEAVNVGFTTGYTDGTNQFASGASYEDASSDVNERAASSTRVLHIPETDPVPPNGYEASIVSLDSDGFTINVDEVYNNGDAVTINYLALAGSDLQNVWVGSDFGFSGPPHSVTGVGFQPNLLVPLPVRESSTGEEGARCGVGFGVARGTATDGSDQWAVGIEGRNNDENSGQYISDGCIVLPHANDGAAEQKWHLDSFDSDGFTLGNDAGGASFISSGWLALQLSSNVSTAVGSVTQPTSTGQKGETGVGFQPGVVLFGGDDHTATGWTQPGEMMLGGAVSSTSRFSIWGGHADNTASAASDSAHTIANVLTSWLAGTPTAESEADFVSMDSDGFTLYWGTVDSTQRVYPYLALEDPSGGGGSTKTITTGDSLEPSDTVDVPRITLLDL